MARLRREATARAYRDLFSDQRASIALISDLLLDALETAGASARCGARSERVRGRFHLDSDRASRLAFISGPRGTGKTVTLLRVRPTARRLSDLPMTHKRQVYPFYIHALYGE